MCMCEGLSHNQTPSIGPLSSHPALPARGDWCQSRDSIQGDHVTPIIQYTSVLSRSLSIGKLNHGISVECQQKHQHQLSIRRRNDCRITKQGISTENKLRLAIHVNAHTPFQILLSQVKYPSPSCSPPLLIPWEEGSWGERERNPKPPESLLTKWPERSEGSYSTMMRSLSKSRYNTWNANHVMGTEIMLHPLQQHQQQQSRCLQITAVF